MAIAEVGAVHSLAPAEPFAHARAQYVWPGVRAVIVTRVAVDRATSLHGPLAASANCTV
jgi:hypothetical protein